MSLNSEQMLPDRMRKMRQMEDLLNAEDIILAEIERIIEDMYQSAALLHEELINEAWLEEKLETRTGAEVSVTADADQLLTSFILNVSKVYSVDTEDVRRFIEKWLPAHLMYKLFFLLEGSLTSSEEFYIVDMAMGFESQFWPARTLNGTWLLDGSFFLDAIRKKDDCGIGYDIGDTQHQESMVWELSHALNVKMMEERFSMPMAEFGISYLDVVPSPIVDRICYYSGNTGITENWHGGVITTRNYWLLDGKYNLNGAKILNSMKTEEDL